MGRHDVADQPAAALAGRHSATLKDVRVNDRAAAGARVEEAQSWQLAGLARPERAQRRAAVLADRRRLARDAADVAGWLAERYPDADCSLEVQRRATGTLGQFGFVNVPAATDAAWGKMISRDAYTAFGALGWRLGMRPDEVMSDVYMSDPRTMSHHARLHAFERVEEALRR